jgi:hypothetical protein
MSKYTPPKTRRFILRRYDSDANGNMVLTEIRIDRLADGALRIDTDKIPEVTHDKADALVKYLIKDAGGECETTHKAHGDHSHLHEEVHEHHHEHN